MHHAPWNALWLPAIKLLFDCTKITSRTLVPDPCSKLALTSTSTRLSLTQETLRATTNNIIIDGHAYTSFLGDMMSLLSAKTNLLLYLHLYITTMHDGINFIHPVQVSSLHLGWDL